MLPKPDRPVQPPGGSNRSDSSFVLRVGGSDMGFDLVVISSGTAARVAAFRVRAAGWSVAIVDEKPFGGT